eukprot:TRINITY_DN270_c1_g2_i1.p1 TRINITY_DN270_c1_g2~~TRINITY_DN270_c1_g2_i1.p1  ORF type:complete len:511 (+),score=110.48 TRINITY_DN270_c1_g2_i1:531-2063(+)
MTTSIAPTDPTPQVGIVLPRVKKSFLPMNVTAEEDMAAEVEIEAEAETGIIIAIAVIIVTPIDTNDTVPDLPLVLVLVPDLVPDLVLVVIVTDTIVTIVHDPEMDPVTEAMSMPMTTNRNHHLMPRTQTPTSNTNQSPKNRKLHPIPHNQKHHLPPLKQQPLKLKLKHPVHQVHQVHQIKNEITLTHQIKLWYPTLPPTPPLPSPIPNTSTPTPYPSTPSHSQSFSDIGGGGSGNSSRRGYGATKSSSSRYGSANDGDSQYIRTSQTIETNIQKIARNSKTIEDMIQRLGTSKDTHEFRIKLERVTKQTSSLAKETADLIKRLATFDGGSLTENKLRRQQQTKLRNDFQEVLKMFELVSRESAEHQKHTMARERALSASAHDMNYDVEQGEKAGLLDEHQRAQQLQLENELEFNETIIQEREESIKEVEQAINEVNLIFKDMAVIVNEQGKQLENIEAIAEKSSDRVADGVTDLRKASKWQKAARNKMCILLVIILVVGGVVTLLALPSN